jgi:hypothetical protein
MRQARWIAAAAAVLCAVTTLAGCIGVPKAAKATFDVTDTAVTISAPDGGRLDGSGETVILLRNFTKAKRQLVLVEGAFAADNLPSSVLDANRASDDKRIVAISSKMGKVKVVASFGTPQPDPTTTRLHVYLRAGRTYTLFDQLGGYRQGMLLTFTVPA